MPGTSAGCILYMYTPLLIILVFNYYQGNYNKTRGTAGENVSAFRANDPADEALYAAAKLRFWSDVQRYAVTPESCRARGCYLFSYTN